MSNSTALQVMRAALQQYGYMESPAGSNRTKFGKWFGMNGEPWCSIFVDWSGDQPVGGNPFARSANAAGIQDLTVKNKGGKYILKHTANNKKKKEALPNVKFGDSISFNFNGGSSRDHTGLAIGRWRDSIYCIEGNTSFGEKGSQSNGGCVAIRERDYTTGVCIVRPAYSASKFHVPDTQYAGAVPELPGKGYFEYKDKGKQVKNLQKALSWANGYKLDPDGDFGGKTFAEVVIFQVANKLEPDGKFGNKCLAKLKELIKKNAPKTTTTATVATKAKATVKKKATYNEKLAKVALECSYPAGTPKKKWSKKTGKPKKEYKKLLDKIFPKHKKWAKAIRTGASCAVAMATFIRASIDKKFPCNDPVKQAAYMERSDKWKRVKWKDVKKGDVIVTQKKKGSRGHIMMYVDKNHICEAVYNKAYPHVRAMPKKMKTAKAIKKNFRSLKIYRRV